MNYERLQTELLQAFRGRRSQAAMSRRLGYRSNVLFDWESGRRQPSAAKAFGCAAQAGIDLDATWTRFWPQLVGRCSSPNFQTDAGVAEVMTALRGSATIARLSQELGVSRFTVGRWLKAQVTPSFAEFLQFLDVTTLRLVDFCAELVNPERLPSISEQHEKLKAARQLAYDYPWSHAVLRALELREYQTLPAHESGFFARRFGISQNEEEKCLELLIRSGQVERCGARLRLNESSVVDTRHDPVRSRQLRAFYSDVAKARLLADQEGDFSFNLFGVSKKDLERLRVLQRDHFAEMRRIIAESEPVEAVVLMNMHLVPLA